MSSVIKFVNRWSQYLAFSKSTPDLHLQGIKQYDRLLSLCLSALNPQSFLGGVPGLWRTWGGGSGKKERKKMDFCVSNSIFLCSNPLAPSRTVQSSALLHGNNQESRISAPGPPQSMAADCTHIHAYTQPGGTPSITLAGHSRVNKDCSPLPDLPAAQPFHPRADTMYSLQAQKQCRLNPFKRLDPCTEGRAECLRGLCDFFRSIYSKCTVSQLGLDRNNKT